MQRDLTCKTAYDSWISMQPFLESSSEGVLAFASEGLIGANGKALEIFDCESVEALRLMGADFSFDICGNNQENRKGTIRKYSRSDGTKQTLQCRCSPVSDTGLYLLFIADHTEFFEIRSAYEALSDAFDARIEEEAERTQKQNEQFFQQSRLAQMGEMISMIAHQWRQPISAVASAAIALQTKARLGNFDMLSDEGREETRRYLIERMQMIAEYIDTMSRTIEDFRSFYKKDREKESVALKRLLDRTFGILMDSLEQKGIVVQTECDEALEIHVYPNEIVQVFLNIFQNSYDQFNERYVLQPKITVQVEQDSQWIRIRICDNAGGIPKSVIEKVFRPYYSTKEERNGTGLGLYMSSVIIKEHHGGQIDATNFEEGACFIITLPGYPDEGYLDD